MCLLLIRPQAYSVTYQVDQTRTEQIRSCTSPCMALYELLHANSAARENRATAAECPVLQSKPTSVTK
jgi:hypothetical protein